MLNTMSRAMSSMTITFDVKHDAMCDAEKGDTCNVTHDDNVRY